MVKKRVYGPFFQVAFQNSAEAKSIVILKNEKGLTSLSYFPMICFSKRAFVALDQWVRSEYAEFKFRMTAYWQTDQIRSIL